MPDTQILGILLMVVSGLCAALWWTVNRRFDDRIGRLEEVVGKLAVTDEKLVHMISEQSVFIAQHYPTKTEFLKFGDRILEHLKEIRQVIGHSGSG